MNNLTPADFIRVNNDTNGNPRYVCHFLHFVPDNIGAGVDKYRFAVRFANKFGGRKYHTKKHGGGVVFTSPDGNLEQLCNCINADINFELKRSNKLFTLNNALGKVQELLN